MNIFTGSRYWATVDISWMFISTEASPANVDDQRVGMGDLDADRRRQAISHGAETTEVIQRYAPRT